MHLALISPTVAPRFRGVRGLVRGLGQELPTPPEINIYAQASTPSAAMTVASSASQAGQTLASAAPLPIKLVSTAGTIATGTAPLWTSASWAIPVIGGIVAGVTLAITAWFNRKGPKQKVATTKIVNDLEPYLQQNLSGYQSGPHTQSSQAQALANFDAVWETLVENCRTEQMGDPGVRCVEDRQAGACHWRDASGNCWNWFIGYRDPIANDPNVVPDPVLGDTGQLIDAVTGELSSLAGAGGGMGWLLLAGAAVFLAFSMGGGK